ncbi:MAG: DNA adenine methylase [Dehalococcoidia bacterium]
MDTLTLRHPPSQPSLQPIVKWPGGKRWILPHIEPLWDRHRGSRLVEPMAGGLAVALGLAPDHATLNDINPHLINLYRQVRDGLTLDRRMENDEAFYYAARAEFNARTRSGDFASPESAQLFYYLNRTGYNGLCRFNSKGEYNVPFGQYSKITYGRDLDCHARMFARWEFTCGDFAAITLSPGDFVYADPPYDVEFTKYSQNDFVWDDQVRLAHWLASHDGPVALSNQATPRILDLYERLGFAIRLLAGPRRISCTGDRDPAREVLATRGL